MTSVPGVVVRAPPRSAFRGFFFCLGSSIGKSGIVNLGCTYVAWNVNVVLVKQTMYGEGPNLAHVSR